MYKMKGLFGERITEFFERGSQQADFGQLASFESRPGHLDIVYSCLLAVY